MKEFPTLNVSSPSFREAESLGKESTPTAEEHEQCFAIVKISTHVLIRLWKRALRAR